MDNKGFTLVELLAVIVILISISFVAVGGISSSLEKRNEKECEEQRELAISAAKMYFSLNNEDITSSSVYVKTLIENNYFSDDSKVDRLDPNSVIKLSSDKTKYEISGSCIE